MNEWITTELSEPTIATIFNRQVTNTGQTNLPKDPAKYCNLRESV